MAKQKEANPGVGVSGVLGEYNFNPLTMKPPMGWDDVRNAYLIHQSQTFKYLNEIYKNYYMWTKDREAQLIAEKEEWKTNIRAPITHMFTNGMFNLLLQSDLNFTAIDRNGKFKGVVEDIMNWADYIMSSEDTMDTFYSACFDACLIGWGHYKTWYKYTKKKYTYLGKNGKDQTIEDVDDYPYIRYVSPYNLFTIGGYNSFNTRFWVERRIIPIQKVEDEYKLLKLKLQKANIANGTFVDQVDWDAIKTNMSLYNVAEGNNIFTDATFNITNKFVEIFELTTENTISIWINQVFHGTFPKLGPYKKMDYHTISFKKNPGSHYGVGIGYIVKPIQYAFDAILNMRIDNVKLAMNKMFFVDSQASFFENEGYMRASPGKVIKVRDPSSVKEINISEVNNSAYGEIDSLFGLTQGLVGLSSPMLGMQGKVERSATGSEMIKEAADSQLRYVLKSISRNMGDTLKEMLILSLVYADEETFARVLGPDNELSKVDLKDLMDNVTFSLDATGPKSQNITLNNQQMLQLIQLAPQLIGEDGKPVLKVAELAAGLLKSMNVDPSSIMDEVEEPAGHMVPAPNPEQVMPPVDGNITTPAMAPEDPMAGMMGAMQQIPGAGVPPEMMTNPTGVNMT